MLELQRGSPTLVELKIRKPLPDDAHFINEYWKDATESDLVRMGELQRPDPKGTVDFINWFCSTALDPTTAAEDIRLWCVDGCAAGYSTLKAIRYGTDAQIHLHLGRSYWRKGTGAVFFCLSARDFLNSYKLRDLYCQPKSENPMANGMLKKVGFELLGT